MITPHKTSAARLLLAEHLKESGMSYTQLAATLDLSAMTVYGWLRGHWRPRVELWPRIEEATHGAVPAIAWTQPEVRP